MMMVEVSWCTCVSDRTGQEREGVAAGKPRRPQGLHCPFPISFVRANARLQVFGFSVCFSESIYFQVAPATITFVIDLYFSQSFHVRSSLVFDFEILINVTNVFQSYDF